MAVFSHFEGGRELFGIFDDVREKVSNRPMLLRVFRAELELAVKLLKVLRDVDLGRTLVELQLGAYFSVFKYF